MGDGSKGSGSGDCGSSAPRSRASREMEGYLHEHIPLTRAMEVGVRHMDGSCVVLSAPLAPNINHRDTAFGGSVSTLAILAAWTLVHTRLRASDLSAYRIVIQRSEMEYLEPIHGEMEAVCHAPAARRWDRFVETIRRKGTGRIRMESEVLHGGLVVARFSGAFVALPPESGG